MDRAVLLEAYFFYEAGDTSVYRCYVLPHLGIVSIFDIPQMHETGTYICKAKDQQADYKRIVECFLYFARYHDCKVFSFIQEYW